MKQFWRTRRRDGRQIQRANGASLASLASHKVSVYLPLLRQPSHAHREITDDTVQFSGVRQAEDSAYLSQQLTQFLLTPPATPFLVLDLNVVRTRFQEMQLCFPEAAIHYAVKANPAAAIIAALAVQGSSFDIASPQELELCLSLGVPAERLSYGNTIKKSHDIAAAYVSGVRHFTFDSEAELDKLAVHAPGANVFCRVLTTGDGAAWPLSKKFGCNYDTAYSLILRSRNQGLVPAGLSFHVGSQQTDPYAWRRPLQEVATLYQALARQGVRLTHLNVGGGFPARYQGEAPPLSHYAKVIQDTIKHLFDTPLTLVLEPGRSLVADAGVIQSEVVLIDRKSQRDSVRWVYLDIGKFGGLAETMDEAIQYRIHTPRSGPTGPVILAGPTCDSADILYEKTRYELPLTLRIGDRLEFLSAGAYTSSYASVGFNGFPPLATYCLGGN
jgi:ornithine decarboxylase